MWKYEITYLDELGRIIMFDKFRSWLEAHASGIISVLCNECSTYSVKKL